MLLSRSVSAWIAQVLACMGRQNRIVGFWRAIGLSVSPTRRSMERTLWSLFWGDYVGSLLRLGVVYFRALGCVGVEGLKRRWNSFVSSRGCLGCCTKPTPIIAVDEPSKGLKIQGRTVKKQSVSEDFWSTSTYEMENSGVHSQRSISSISTSTQTLDNHGGQGSSSNPSEFVNHGLLLWNQTRQQWVGNKKRENRAQQVQEPRLSWNATYDNLLGTNKPFPQPIPLSEMIDFLVDVWEQEGMYD